MAADDQERTEQATAKHREESRKRGEVVRSQDVTSAALILVAAWCLSGMGPMLFSGIDEMTARTWSSLASGPMTQQAFSQLMRSNISGVLLILLPFTGLLALVGIVSAVAQHGFLFTTTPLAPNWSRINPLSGFERIFSMQALMSFGKTIMKFIVITSVAYLVIRKEFPSVFIATDLSPRQIVAMAGGIIVRLILWSGLVIAVIGIADYGFQWWEHERKLRMSKQELKEEAKQTEGAPLVRSRIRSLQREMARKRMMSDVPKADVVITNPTSLAVALVYQPGSAEAPKVVAKGAGFVAQKVREIAREHGIPMVENKPLARAIFKTVEVGEMIPSRFYRAVAEILAYVYRLRGKRSPHPL